MNKHEVLAVKRAVWQLVQAAVAAANAGAYPPDEALVLRLENKLAEKTFSNLLLNLTERKDPK